MLLTLLAKVVLLDNTLFYPESLGHVKYKKHLIDKSKFRKKH